MKKHTWFDSAACLGFPSNSGEVLTDLHGVHRLVQWLWGGDTGGSGKATSEEAPYGSAGMGTRLDGVAGAQFPRALASVSDCPER